MDGLESLLRAIEIAARSRPLVVPGDSNMIDIYWHVGKVARLLKPRLPTGLPTKEMGVALVECVESFFIRGSLIRQLPSQILAERGGELVRSIQANKLLSFEPHECYITSLYTWHGCINMAKLLRKTYVVPNGERPYTLKERKDGYDELQTCWIDEQSKGNPWIRYGVSLARLLEIKRKKEKFKEEIIEDWAPLDSPYWAK